ncbi:MAG: protein translocase subunit SecF [Dictyoglomus sp. NZ13-RE01]|nr:MAG: protein translocase subunit SecF [Dictyoglomus sp. NZ13-RE01]
MKEINFLGKNVRRFYFAVSLIFIIICIVSLFTKGLNYSIDFQSGTLIHYKLENPLNTKQISEIRRIVNSMFAKSMVQTASDLKEVWIRTKPLNDEEYKKLSSELEKILGKYTGKDLTTIEPTISKELTEKAILASVLAVIVMLVYITLRFRFDYAISAIVGETFVILGTIGLFSIFQWEVSPSFIAALLTLLGYDINDAIIVFDRIRENIKLYPKEDFVKVANKSINQVLVRTLYTVITTLLAITPLLIMGGEVLRPFIIALYLGILLGTYSNIFVASGLLTEFREVRKA